MKSPNLFKWIFFESLEIEGSLYPKNNRGELLFKDRFKLRWSLCFQVGAIAGFFRSLCWGIWHKIWERWDILCLAFCSVATMKVAWVFPLSLVIFSVGQQRWTSHLLYVFGVCSELRYVFCWGWYVYYLYNTCVCIGVYFVERSCCRLRLWDV